jgi:hypothetical protein
MRGRVLQRVGGLVNRVDNNCLEETLVAFVDKGH